MTKKIILPVLTLLMFVSCKKETETLQVKTISEYAPLEVGKYITYQLDSFRYLPFSLQGVTTSHQAKYIVDAPITDNLGRQGFRILKMMRSDETQPWRHDNTFMAFQTEDSYEFIENNLRYLKMSGPVKNGFSWKGNSYIDVLPPDITGTDLGYLDGWDYTYDSVAAPLTIGTFTLENTLKVAQRDEVLGYPDDPYSYNEINYGVEYYAKGIGLVYKRFFHSVYQPPPPPPLTGDAYYLADSKGYTLTMIDHN